MQVRCSEMRRAIELVVLALTLASSAAVSIILTFLPCYSTLCSEEYFPFETRLHLIIYYGFLILTGFFLLLRSYNSTIRSLTNLHLVRELPIVGKRVTLGGILCCFWILAVAGAPTGFWLPAQDQFWGLRTDPLNWVSAKLQLTITGVTGHYADILLGLLLIPVSRNSLVGNAFSLHHSTLLYAHKLVAYLFSLSATAHGVTYILYASDSSSEGDLAKEEAFATGNPAMTLSESKQRSEWFTLTTYTGIAALLPVFLILLTSIPWVRRRHYNIFYFSHVILGTIIFVASCIHASTDFYMLLPGLLLWIIDWTRRLFFGETSGLANKVSATLTNADNGWLRISLPDIDTLEVVSEKGTAAGQPLLHYYLNFPTISKVQNHAFTAAIPSSDRGGPIFLLQRTTGKSQKKLDKEWTWKLGNLVPQSLSAMELPIRVEGPYPSGDTDFKAADHIVCIVGGTGFTGACSLARWWSETRSHKSRFTLIWTTRYRESTAIEEWQILVEAARSTLNLSVTAHVSSEVGRLDPVSVLQSALDAGRNVNSTSRGKAWVYSSGPDALVNAAQHACVELQKDIHASIRGKTTRLWTVSEVSWYMAKWEV